MSPRVAAPASKRGARRSSVVRALDRLEAALGRPVPQRRLAPLDELVLTILSQNTSDTNRDRAFAALRRRFPSWEAVLAAPRSDLEDAIRPGGLARTKSRVIREMLQRIHREQGRLSLDRLKRMPVDEGYRYLRSFRGVGEKTACCVLLFACGLPAFPVDTHIHRIARRVGWVPEGAGPDDSHRRLASLIPRNRYYPAHINLITLGRRLCRPRAPACPSCPLRRSCRFARRAAASRVSGRTRGGSRSVAFSGRDTYIRP